MSEPEAPPESPHEPSVDVRLVRDLADVLNQTGLTEIEIERSDVRIRVAKTVSAAAHYVAAPPTAVAPSAAAQAAPAAAATAASPAAPTVTGNQVKSPMVGTVYLQSQPGAPPFVKVGDRVTEGQTLLLVEAMKTMNPITAPMAGVLVDMLVADGQPVEYGEPLAVIG